MVTPDFRLPRKTKGLFALTNWDAVPVAAAIAHLAFVVWIVAGFDQRPWWGNLGCGGLYALAISWNINSVSHNFLHTPYFRWKPLNYAFSLLESVAIGFSQVFYTWVHLRHHEGNSDRPGPDGTTRDWLSIYRHGRNGQPENVWSYVFLGFFRDGGEPIYQALKKRRPFDADWGRLEIASFALFVVAMALISWKAVLFLIPFYYLGECLSQLNGYYEHFRGDPDTPLAWGVSTYARLYNLTWFNNGHHAEHHYRPAVHWTRLPALHRAIAAQQQAAGVHVIAPPHALGFLAQNNREPNRVATSAPVKDRGFKLSGTGEKGVLLIHGMSGAPAEMKMLARRLNQRGFAISAPQLAGHGADQATLLKTDWRDWLETARTAYLELAGEVDQVFVAGICAGGALGLRLAADHPEIAGVAVYSMTFEYDGWNMPRLMAAAPIIQLVANLPGIRHISFAEPPPFGLKDERLREWAMRSPDAFIEGALDRMPLGALYQLYRLGRHVETIGRRVGAPTLILHAREDDMSHPRNAWRLRDALGGLVEVRLLGDSYHMIHIDQERKLVADMTATFFESAIVAEQPILEAANA